MLSFLSLSLFNMSCFYFGHKLILKFVFFFIFLFSIRIATIEWFWEREREECKIKFYDTSKTNHMKILFGKFKNAKYIIIGCFWLLYRENSNLNTLENYSFICRNLIFLFFLLASFNGQLSTRKWFFWPFFWAQNRGAKREKWRILE